MGIKGLAKLLADEAPDSVREVPLSSLQGRKIAIDASMAIYQFLIAVRSQNGAGGQAMQLTNADGETTSHVQGLFNRTIRFLTEGIRPVYVFDGKPPTIKSAELGKRKEKREKAEAALKVAEEDGNIEEQDRQNKRLVRAGQKENDDCRRLLELMGVPVIRAPCEAEAQAAALAQRGLVYAAATEDMDALTFRTPILLRKMTFANASKAMIQTINYQKALEGLDLDHDQFVDLCILMGCDYCDSIKGIGPKTALKMIREYKNMETLLSKIDRKKYSVPQSWEPNVKRPKAAESYDTDEEKNDEQDDDDKTTEEIEPIYVQARRLFNHHDVLESPELKFKPCQPEELTRFLVDEMGFNPERVKSNIEKLQKAFQSSAKPQARMDSFFKVIPIPVGEKKNKTTTKSATAGKDSSNKKNGFFGKRKR